MNTALDAYLKREGITDAEFAPAIGRDRSTVSRLRRGVVTPDIELAAQIEDVTDGEVGIKSWLSTENAADSDDPPPFPTPPQGTDHPAQPQPTPAREKPVRKFPTSSTSSPRTSTACGAGSKMTDAEAA